MILDKRSKLLRIFGRLLSKAGYNVSRLKNVAASIIGNLWQANLSSFPLIQLARLKFTFGKILIFTCLAAFSFVSRSILK